MEISLFFIYSFNPVYNDVCYRYKDVIILGGHISEEIAPQVGVVALHRSIKIEYAPQVGVVVLDRNMK